MGTKTNQIATWRDLDLIGYRLPYGASNFLDKGVTYKDLNSCSRGYLSAYYSSFNALTESQKRLYVTNHLDVPFNHSVSLNVHDIVQEQYFNSGLAVESTIKSNPSTVETLIWYNFTLPVGVHSASVTFSEAPLQVLIKAIRGVVSMVNISYKMRIVDSEDNTIWTSSLISTTVACGVRVVLPTLMPTSAITLTNLSGHANQIYYIKVDWFYHNMIDKTLSAQFCGPNDDVVLTLALSDKCVPWNKIKGVNGQTVLTNNSITVPIQCKIIERVTDSTKANNIAFYYCYTTSSGTSGELAVGYINLANDGDKIKEESSGICNVLVNPKVNGVVVSDYLKIASGTTGVAQTWKIRFTKSNSTYGYIELGKWKTCPYSFTQYTYQDAVKNISYIELRIT